MGSKLGLHSCGPWTVALRHMGSSQIRQTCKPQQVTAPLSLYAVIVGADTPTACCFSYAARQLSRKIVADYFETSSQCSKPGVIFQTKRGRQVCANPSEDWVQEYVTDLELNS
ncbi:hypothetical protein JEQ12_003345 [Ovis aries]|uniref:C-C motif chemokine n=1 Tax=Ovis aries TaxID=9940 RepID=A0A835ZWU2_SHEEP|nr:hypothetical protein JEQ12_003345 [Ovis aries]